MVDSGGVSACPVDYAPECEVSSGSVKLPLVGAGGDRIEHIGQKTVGYATRDESKNHFRSCKGVTASALSGQPG